MLITRATKSPGELAPPDAPMSIALRSRRACLLGWSVSVLAWSPLSVQADTTDAWQALKTNGSIVLFRHAIAPGGGDPAGWVAGDCRTQRNLSAEGQAQARRIGDTLRQRGVEVGAVWHSEWCRTRDTAQLAFPAMSAPRLRPVPAFNSFFNSPGSENMQTAEARRLLLGWRGPGVLVVVTHQVNITALTGLVPQSGEGVVLQTDETSLRVQGTLLP